MKKLFFTSSLRTFEQIVGVQIASVTMVLIRLVIFKGTKSTFFTQVFSIPNTLIKIHSLCSTSKFKWFFRSMLIYVRWLPVSNKTLTLDYFSKCKSPTFTNVVCSKTLVWLFAKLLAEELLRLSNRDSSAFLLKVEILVLCLPLQFLHLQSHVDELTFWPILKQKKKFFFFLQISFCVDGFLTFVRFVIR